MKGQIASFTPAVVPQAAPALRPFSHSSSTATAYLIRPVSRLSMLHSSSSTLAMSPSDRDIMEAMASWAFYLVSQA